MLLHEMLKQKNIYIKGKELSMSSPLIVELFYGDEMYYILYNDGSFCVVACVCMFKSVIK